MGGSSSRERQEKARKIAEEQQKQLALRKLVFLEHLRIKQQQRLQEYQAIERNRLKQQEEKERLERLDRLQQQKREHHISRLIQVRVNPNLELLESFRSALNLEGPRLHHFPDKVYKEIDLFEISPLLFYELVESFRRTTKYYFKPIKITQVSSFFHKLQFELMKQKYKNEYKEPVTEHILYHGTKEEFLDGICTHNFDRNKVRTHKFGRGVSFARDSFYATHYHHDNKRSFEKVMVIAKVLVGMTEIGVSNLEVPEQCYTAVNDKYTVFIKFDDASYYPAFIVYYQGFHR